MMFRSSPHLFDDLGDMCIQEYQYWAKYLWGTTNKTCEAKLQALMIFWSLNSLEDICDTYTPNETIFQKI